MSRDPVPPDIVHHPPRSPRTHQKRLDNPLFTQGWAKARTLQAMSNEGQARRHEQWERRQEEEEKRRASQAVSEVPQRQAKQHSQASLQEYQRTLSHLEASHHCYNPVIENSIFGPSPMTNPDLFFKVSKLQSGHAQQVNVQRTASPVAYLDPQSLSAYTLSSRPASVSDSSSAGNYHEMRDSQLPAQASLDHLPDAFLHNELSSKHTHIQPKFIQSTTTRHASSSSLHSNQLRMSTSDGGIFDNSVSDFRGLPLDTKATTTIAIQNEDASVAPISLAASSSTACPLSGNDRADAATTLSRRKKPETFESAARLRNAISSKHLTKKGLSGLSVYSAEELVLVHRGAKAQIQELKNIEAKNRENFTELQKENARLQSHSRDLDHTLNRRIADEDKIVNERCASREQMSDGLLRDNAADVSALRQEIIKLKARLDDASKKALREIGILQQQRDNARQELAKVKKEMQGTQKRSKAQQAVKPRPGRASRDNTSSTISGNNPAVANIESTSEEDTASRPRARFPARALSIRSLRFSASPYTMNGPKLDDTDLNSDHSSDSYDIPSSSPYKPSEARKRKFGDVDLESSDVNKAGSTEYLGTNVRLSRGRLAGGSEYVEDLAVYDKIDPRDQEAIREKRPARTNVEAELNRICVCVMLSRKD